MTPRAFLNSLRTKTGTFLLFTVAVIVGFILWKGARFGHGQPSKTELKTSDKTSTKPQVVQTVTRDVSSFSVPKESPKASPVPPEPEPPKLPKTAEIPPISLYAGTPEKDAPVDSLSKDYAPFGRLVQCELIVTVDSSTIQTPIIGLVTNDVWHDGRLIIAAGTEVHSTAKVDRVRERIAGNGNWTFVWQTGEELNVSGLALDREHDGENGAWGITDGSAGLRGQLLKSDDLAEVKLFAATFLSGAANGLTEKEQTIFGSQTTSALQNAPLTGAQQVLNVYARQILESIQRDGFYVRVPAGKQFYLYVTQTIDRSKAVIGGTRISSAKVAASSQSLESTDPLTRLQRNLQRMIPANPEGPAREVSTVPLEQPVFFK